MKFLKIKSALITAGAAAICAFTLPATAQNDLYRQGYEDGYRAGIQAARQGQGQGQWQWQGQGQGRGYQQGSVIYIDQASYGIDGMRCDARNTLQSAVQGRMAVDIAVDNNLCGDPAEGRVKSLFVTYRCGNSQPVRTQVREYDILQIRCR